MESYLQEKKCKARHVALKSAITKLTVQRSNCCCVNNMYVRDIYDYLKEEADGTISNEINKIDKDYIKEWEKFQKSYIGSKNVEELSVCYLGGPEPENDFKELVSLGILPHNIWAFENEDKTYHTALTQLCSNGFPRPKLVQMNIERYFKDIPKKFDVFYYDACSTSISKGTLRVISTMCKYHRLNSPGVIITNFAKPDFSHDRELNRTKAVVEPYFSCKEDKNKLYRCGDMLKFNSPVIANKMNIHKLYSDFSTDIVLDIISNSIPIQRFMNSDYARDLLDFEKNSIRKITVEEFNQIHNSIYKFAYLKLLLQQDAYLSETYKNVITSMSGFEGYSIDIVTSFLLKENMKNVSILKSKDLHEVIDFFDSEGNIFQFLDKSDSGLYIDLLINQMGYPLHYITDKIERYEYCAKTNTMMMDIIPVDECRYIYEWLPAADQVVDAFKDKSWQYIFRFAVDGLVKNRMEMNNDIFYKGSVVSKNTNGFKEKHIEERKVL